MDIQIIEHICDSLKVIIQCKQSDDYVCRLKEHIELFDGRIQAKRGNEWVIINPSDALYFEAVDNRTFLYTDSEVLEIKSRLYELEAVLPTNDFIKISKSQIINMNKIVALKPEINRTLIATLNNSEKLYVSRKYVPLLRKQLGLV